MDFLRIYETVLASAEARADLSPEVLLDLRRSETRQKWLRLNEEGPSAEAYLEVGELMKAAVSIQKAHKWFQDAWHTWKTVECAERYITSCRDLKLHRTASRILRVVAEGYRSRGEREELAVSLLLCADSLIDIDDYKGAASCLNEAIPLLRMLVEDGRNDRVMDLCVSLDHRAAIFYGDGDYKACEAALRESMAVQRNLLNIGDECVLPRIGATASNLAVLLVAVGRENEARRMFDEATSLFRRAGLHDLRPPSF